jgi:hypothetical protein
MTTDDTAQNDEARANFKKTLVRVLAVQVVALAVLWLLQMRYHV